MRPIRIVTRKSKLALWQAEYVADMLQQDGHATELVTMETIGDKILDVTIAKIGSKGVFTEELETALAAGEADIAVHSAKDMQSVLPEGFELIAFTEREQMHDVLVSHSPGVTLDQPLTVGTSSTRRTALLKHYYPHIKTVSVRGNLQTRIRKMEDGHCDALMLAYAGIHRMGYSDMIRENIPTDTFIPAVGQGCVAIEAHASLSEDLKDAVKKAVNHEETSLCMTAERAFLRRLEGGCSIPVFGLARLSEGTIQMEGGIVSLDGNKIIRRSVQGTPSHAESLGTGLAEEILNAGGKEILDKIKSAI